MNDITCLSQPSSAARAATAQADELATVARFAHGLRWAMVPAPVRHRVRLMVMDSLGVMVAGSTEARVMRLATSLQRRGSRGHSLFVTGGHGDAADAAQVNATASCAQVLDEGHKFARGHVATYVLPAILAVAEEQQVSGVTFVEALLAGYEVAARMGIACRVRESMHPSGTWGTVGATAATARLIGLHPDRIREAMNVAAPLTLATSWRAAVEGATVRDLYSGCGAAAAVMAPRYVVDGFAGSENDVANVFGSVSSTMFNPAALTAGLGEEWEIMRNYFKIHACCRNFQSGIDVALELRDRHRIDPARIVRVSVETFEIPVRDNADYRPRNVLAARESFPVSLALALLHGRCDASVYTEECVAAPDVARLALRIDLAIDPVLDAMFPNARPTRLTVQLDDGTTVSGYAEVAYGDPLRPVADADLEAKFATCVAARLTPGHAHALRCAIEGVDALSSISELTRHLATSSKPACDPRQ